MTRSTTHRPHSPLEQLAELYGIELEYTDVAGNRVRASEASLRKVLHLLGANADVNEVEAYREYRREQLNRTIEPVVVAWDGKLTLTLTLPVHGAHGAALCQLALPRGDWKCECELEKLPRKQIAAHDGQEYVALSWEIAHDLPMGYYPVTIEAGTSRSEGLVISAPTTAYWPERESENGASSSFNSNNAWRGWGSFVPLYALRTDADWGAGSYADLEELARWTASLGGSFVGTLPLLAAYLQNPCDPSPYSPVSRLFWNEFYIDTTKIPELAHCPAAQAVQQSPQFAQAIADYRAAEYVDFQHVARLKRNLLQMLADCFFASPTVRHADFQRFVEADPLLQDYARFRAVQEKRGVSWRSWPARLREGRFAPDDFDCEAMLYHLYAQWIASEQLSLVAQSARRHGCGLYLDLPLGVRGDAFDAWRYRRQFVDGAHVGAPPDSVWSEGQNWGFPPLHPERIRRDAYRHVRDYLSRQMKFANFLRIDHVMGLHRLFWIPEGMAARDGVYVRYSAEEWYAIIALESHRHRTGVVGENLGTVSAAVHWNMQTHGLRRMSVLQYDLDDPQPREAGDDRKTIASLNTHDLPTFAAWWNGDDLRERAALGVLASEDLPAHFEHRQALKSHLLAQLRAGGWLKGKEAEPPVLQVGAAAQKMLAAGNAELVLINLEDLWAETRPQNTPGTWSERRNWQRKTLYTLECMKQKPEVLDVLREVHRERQCDAGRSRPGKIKRNVT